MILSAALLLMAASGPGPSVAVDMASRSGIVIGAAEACRIDPARLVALGRVVIGQIRDAATGPDDLSAAQRTHEDAVAFSARRIRHAGAGLCPAAEQRLKALEQACLNARRPRCALL